MISPVNFTVGNPEKTENRKQSFEGNDSEESKETGVDSQDSSFTEDSTTATVMPEGHKMTCACLNTCVKW